MGFEGNSRTRIRYLNEKENKYLAFNNFIYKKQKLNYWCGICVLKRKGENKTISVSVVEGKVGDRS